MPQYASAAVGKHCFTTTGHILTHMLEQALIHAQAHLSSLPRLRAGDLKYVSHLSNMPLPPEWRTVSSHLMLLAPEHINMMLTAVVTCFNEMQLPAQERAGPRTCDDGAQMPGRRVANSPVTHGPQRQLTGEDAALCMLLQRCQHQEVITVTQVNSVLPSRFGFRSNQSAISRLFDLAVKEGLPRLASDARSRDARENQMKLRLTLTTMPAPSRNHLNLPPCSVSDPVPTGLPHRNDAEAASMPPPMSGGCHAATAGDCYHGGGRQHRRANDVPAEDLAVSKPCKK